MSKRMGYVVGVLLWLLAQSAWAGGAQRVMVMWAEGVSTPPDSATLTSLSSAVGVELRWVREVAGVASLLEWDADEVALAQVMERLATDPRVSAVEADARRRLQFVPNDARYSEQWYLFDAVGIRAPEAWDLQRGSSTVTVAVLDSGILAHADLDSSRILPGFDFYSNVALDNDGIPGRDADPTDPGDAVVLDECGIGEPAEPSSWHGLTLAGVIMATADNVIGIAGIDHRARLLPIRIFGKCGALSSDILDGMRWAAGLSVAGAPNNPTPAQVVNLSFAGDGACGVVEQAVIDQVIAAGAVVVASAGNGTGIAGVGSGDVALVSPASCAGVITAAAVSRAGVLASYSKVGAAVDITAGVGDGVFGVLTTSNAGLVGAGADVYVAFNGTSYSAAQTSAVVALMRAAKPQATVAQIGQALRDSARPFLDASCNTSLCGEGMLDAAAAVAAAARISTVSAPVGGGGGGGGCTLSSRAASPDVHWFLALLWVVVRVYRAQSGHVWGRLCKGRVAK